MESERGVRAIKIDIISDLVDIEDILSRLGLLMDGSIICNGNHDVCHFFSMRGLKSQGIILGNNPINEGVIRRARMSPKIFSVQELKN